MEVFMTRKNAPKSMIFQYYDVIKIYTIFLGVAQETSTN